MSETRKLVAILAANPALTSILAKPLAGQAGLRVAEFETAQALVTFMRISPLDLIILDADTTGMPAGDFVQSLRSNRRLASPRFDIIALTRTAAAFHQELLDSGFDEILVKPISTNELLDRVVQRLTQDRPHTTWDGVYRGPERRSGRRSRPALSHSRSDARPSNVVPLFGRDRASRQ